jgi:adenylosuccinate synthase
LSEFFINKYKDQKSIHDYFLKENYPSDFIEKENLFFKAVDFLKEFNITDTEYVVNNHIEKNNKVLAEGAQGTLLDIDFGSYPFVTSSNTTTAGACVGLGVSPKKIGNVFGIFKAYCTRVGAGPFPTELFDQVGKNIEINGNEFGSTTGRSRRCGWLDLPALKYSVMLNGVTDLYMMKSDVLSDFKTVNICIGYKYKGKDIDYFPTLIESEDIKPIYKSFNGWSSNINNCRNYNNLDQEFKDYINFIQDNLGVPIKLISLGPDREATVLVN